LVPHQGLSPITEAELQSSESIDKAEQEELLVKLKDFGFEQVRVSSPSLGRANVRLTWYRYRTWC
jgi:hypothetical protein